MITTIIIYLQCNNLKQTKMVVDTENLMTLTNFARSKSCSRQWLERCILAGQVNQIKIDGVYFVIMDSKAISFKKKKVV